MRLARKSFFLLLACCLCHATFTCALSLTRIYTYKSSLLDGGTFAQALWNLAHHGIALSTTNAPWTDQNWFGFHFSPVLYLLVPFYALWPHLALLQVVQSVCFALSGVILFYALKAAGAQPWQAWAGSLLYWSNPFVLSAALWDFHEIAFSTLFITIALWALFAQQFRTMVLALMLLLLTKEHYGLSVAGFGFLWGLRTHQWRRGGLLMILGIASLIIILTLIMPALYNATPPMLTATGTLGRYGWLHQSMGEMLHTFAQLLFSAHNNIPGLLYLMLLLLSGLMLPLLAPLYLAPALADLLANLLSANPMPRHLASYHSAALIPIVIIAAYRGLRVLEHKAFFPATLFKTMLVMLALVFPLGGLTFYSIRFWELTDIVLTPGTADIRVIGQLMGDIPVSAQANIGMFFANREQLYPFPAKIEAANAVVLQLAQPFHDTTQARMNIPYNDSYSTHVRQFLLQPDWHVAYWHAPWLVMMRGEAAQNENAVRADIARHIDALVQ